MSNGKTQTMNALARFFERLPSMLTDFKLAEMQYEYETKLKGDALDLQANIDHYNDQKSVSQHWEGKVQEVEANYAASGASLDALNEVVSTANAEHILQSFTDIDAKDYAGKADIYANNSEYYKERYNQVLNIINTDLRDAKAVLTGGAGIGPNKEWDLGDIGMEVYMRWKGMGDDPTTPELEVGDLSEISPVVTSFFEANPPNITTLSQLQQAEYTYAANAENIDNLAKGDSHKIATSAYAQIQTLLRPDSYGEDVETFSDIGKSPLL